ncbi:MAG: hypothetical protein DWH78_13925 [Planctomycetota bacterium]|jgi:hypothetical protein|nr:MAG: hypothetical protein DWH78_13925 [Planctomycetota bacterium]
MLHKTFSPFSRDAEAKFRQFCVSRLIASMPRSRIADGRLMVRVIKNRQNGLVEAVDVNDQIKLSTQGK